MVTKERKVMHALKVCELKLQDYTAWFLLTGPVTQARYNPLWFLRRNEVMVPVSDGV